MKKVRIKGLGDREFDAWDSGALNDSIDVVLVPVELIEPVPEYREVRWPEDYGKEVEVRDSDHETWGRGPFTLVGKRLDGRYVTETGARIAYTWYQARVKCGA